MVCGLALFTLKNGYVKMKVKQKKKHSKGGEENG